jgi:ParB-like nuclease family protein
MLVPAIEVQTHMEPSTDRPTPELPLEITLVNLDRVLPTEEVDPDLVDTLAAGMAVSGIWTHPLLVEIDSLAVLDGHHRLAAAKRIGLRSVPALSVSYDDPRVHVEAWRPGRTLPPAEIIARARAGRLLPYKSTRHITDFVIPQVRVPIQALRDADAHGSQVAIAGRHPPRSMMLVPDYNRLCFRLRIRPDAASNLEIETPETQAPHIQLRRSLQSDPAMAALLPVVSGRLVLGSTHDSPFLLKRNGLLHLPGSLLSCPAALSIAARWGLEAAYLQSCGLLSPQLLTGIALHGKSLLRAASIDSCDALLEGLPECIAEELMDFNCRTPSSALLGWQRSRLESLADGAATPAAADGADVELWHCVEELLVAGGDSRITIDRRTGFNRYGTTLRPRPEAVQFSSSTASSISDYGFTYCEVLRRDLLAALLREGVSAAQLRARTVDALGLELLDLLALTDEEADVVMAPSGTDTELLAVLLSIASAAAVTNILIAPDETGRGVRAAGAGLYFDAVAASGDAIKKGQPAWPRQTIRVVEIPIRDDSGTPRSSAGVIQNIRCEIEQALARHDRVLLHVLASSKTGLQSPPFEAVDELVKPDRGAIDVVVDACQMRNPFAQMGEWVRRGWMVQVSGSKFLTGPPFSAALILPRSLRLRAGKVAALLDEAPAVGSKQDWNSWWRRQFGIPANARAASFGAIFRWLPALLEARLFSAIPSPLQESSFSRFRTAMNEKLDASQWLVRMQGAEGYDSDERGRPNLATRSIICFAALASHWDGTKRTMDEEECRRIFQLLNLDLTGKLGELSVADRARAGFQAHIGQPVVVKASSGTGSTAMLRMVLGARFFSIVAHAGPGSVEAALESEIGDAIRALEKLELLARLWRKARHIAI